MTLIPCPLSTQGESEGLYGYKKTYQHKNGHVYFEETKTDYPRQVPISDSRKHHAFL